MSSLLQTYHQFPIKITRGKGSYVWDDKGKKYLDFYSGHAVCLLGHCPEPVVKAINEQSKKLIFYSNIFSTGPAEKLANILSKTLLPSAYLVYLTNSGSEANETAIKIARKYTGKKNIISFKNSFHGRGIYPLGVTGIDHYHMFEPNVDRYTSFAEFGDINSVKKAFYDCTTKPASYYNFLRLQMLTPAKEQTSKRLRLKKLQSEAGSCSTRQSEHDIAAVICETIQSIGGINMAPKKFYQDLAKFCAQKNILLIFDEVQTGLGRTGTFWLSQSLGVKPDIITTAKGIASGLPLSAVLIKKKIADTIKVGDHATTFGGGPLVCSSAIATLSTILKKGFLKRVQEKEKYLRAKLAKIPAIKEIRGKGLLLGLKLDPIPADLINKCLKNGLIIGSSSAPGVFRLMPPLTVTKREIDEFVIKFSVSLRA